MGSTRHWRRPSRLASALPAVLALLALLMACSSDEPPPLTACEGEACDDEGPCSGITCGDEGRCELAGGLPVCHCVRGFDAVGLACVRPGQDPCAGAPCSGGCVVTPDDGARCRCGDGERSTGLGCVTVDAPVCAGVACSGHGRCDEVDGLASCSCDEGYAPTPDRLGCARVAPAEACVVANEPRCAPGRGFSACCRGMSCEYRFEDGKVLRGLGAAATYCKGEIPSLDGACEGTPVACATLNGQEEPCWAAGCSFIAGTGECAEPGASRACDTLGEARWCRARPGCQWIAAPSDEDPANIADGLCAGTPAPCASHGDDASRCRRAGCDLGGSGCSPGGDLHNTCAKHRSPGTCADAPGCHWVPPHTADDWRCAQSTGLCKEGRSHALCCDNVCEARFEDGITLRGDETAIGYCLGALDSARDDGSCTSACWQIADEAACAAATCSWEGDRCGRTNLACFGGYDRQTCAERPACFWVEQGGSTRLPEDSSTNGYVEDQIALPVISSPPFPPGTSCPESCRHGCLVSSGKVVIANTGEPKPLPNMSFCFAAGAPILAVAAGEVVAAGATYLGDGDYAVNIRSTENPNFAFIYDHVAAPTVSVGDVVKPGDPIAISHELEGAGGFELQVNELRGPQPHQVVINCPARYATSEVNAALSTHLLAGHLSSATEGWRSASWTLCERASVQAY